MSSLLGGDERTSKLILLNLLPPNPHKLQRPLGTNLIPLLILHRLLLRHADRDAHAIPIPAAEAILDDLADLPDQAPRLIGIGPRRRGGDGKDDDDAAEHVEDFLGLVGEERGGPVGGGGDEVEPDGDGGGVVRGLEVEGVRCACEGFCGGCWEFAG